MSASKLEQFIEEREEVPEEVDHVDAEYLLHLKQLKIT